MSTSKPTKFWDPSNPERPNWPERPKVEDFRELVNHRYKLNLKNYWDLHKWSCENLQDYWNAAWDWSGVIGDRGNEVRIQDLVA